jgi:drug/metabolite transporter (DMT)-like permease
VTQGTRVWTALVVVYILWGSTYLGIAVAGETIPPLFAASTRFIAAGAIMAAFVRLRGGSLRVGRRELVSCIVVGCLLPGANAVLFFAERSVATGLASLIIASVPLWIVLFRLAGRERMSTLALVGVALGFAGVAILAHPSANAKLWGIGLCVASAVMWGAGSFVSARAPMPADPFAATAYEMLAGGVVMLIPSLFTVHHFSPSAGSIGGWIYLVTFGSVVGYTAYVWLLANAPIGLVATYAYVNPVVAITLGVMFRGEHLSWRLLLGAIVVIAAVALVVRQEPASVPADEGVPESERVAA